MHEQVCTKLVRVILETLLTDCAAIFLKVRSKISSLTLSQQRDSLSLQSKIEKTCFCLFFVAVKVAYDLDSLYRTKTTAL